MDVYRLVWGERLENEMKCGEVAISSDPTDGGEPDSEEFIQRWEWLAARDPIQMPFFPFVCLYFVEGKGWVIINYNSEGYELYGDSIMGEDIPELNPYSDMCYDWQVWWQIQRLDPDTAGWYFNYWYPGLDMDMDGVDSKLIASTPY